MKKICVIRWLLLALFPLLMGGCGHYCPDYQELRECHAEYDRTHIEVGEVLSCHPLTLDDIIEISLCRNLDLRVKEFEAAVQCELASSEALKMLPKLEFSLNKTSRNKDTGAFSQSLTNRPPAPPSISRDQHLRTGDATFTWNILDFGLSFFRSRQEGNRAAIKKMEYCRQTQNIILDATREFWRAVVSKHAIEHSQEIMSMATAQRAALRKSAKLRLIAQNVDFAKEDQLLRIERTLHAYEKTYHQAKVALSVLMGIPPGTRFEIEDPMCEPFSLEVDEVSKLECLALRNRPELYSADFEGKIDADEVRASILRLFPAVSLFAGDNYDSNSFTIHNWWQEVGIRAIWDLLTIPSQLKYKRAAGIKEQQSNWTRVALSLGAISQVHLAHSVLHDDLTEYELAKEHHFVKHRMWEIAKSQEHVGLMAGADVLEYQADALDMQLDALEAYGNVQIGLEQLNNAIGLPRHFQTTCETGDSHVAFND